MLLEIKHAKPKVDHTKSVVQLMSQQETAMLKLISYKNNQSQLPLMLQTGLYIEVVSSAIVLPD